MNSSGMFSIVHGCRGLCSHGKFWVLFSGGVFHDRFLFLWLLGQVFLHPFVWQGPCEPSSGRFPLNTWPFGKFVPCTFSCSAVQHQPLSLSWDFPHPSHLPVVIRFLWHDSRKWGAEFFWGWMIKAEQTLLDLSYLMYIKTCERSF